jgi:hypothetical protein
VLRIGSQGVSLEVLRGSLLAHVIRPLIPQELSAGTEALCVLVLLGCFPHPREFTIPTTPEQEWMMRKFIEQWKENYNFTHRNCADFVLRTLEAAGFRVKWWLVMNRRMDPMTGAWLFEILQSGFYDIN